MELIIDKNTKLNKIENKEDYTSLVIKTKVNPKKLNGFINVKDLTIKRYKSGFNVYNERHINELPFKEGIEKLTLDDIGNYGRDEKFNVAYHLLMPNLKEITFIDDINSYFDFYLEKCTSLEKVNIKRGILKYGFNKPSCCLGSKYLKTLVIDDKFICNFEYPPYKFEFKTWGDDILEINYNKTCILSKVCFDKENNISTTEHVLDYITDDLINNNILIIPDYVTYIRSSIGRYSFIPIEGISINLNLLKTHKEKTRLIGNYDLNNIKKIIIRSNNEMSLYPNKEIDVEENLKELYIENNKLHIVYEDKIIIIDELGNKTNNDLKSINKKNDYETKEEYIYLKKLLEIINTKYKDEELTNAIKVIGKKIIKKLTK